MITGRFMVYHGETEIAGFDTFEAAKRIIPWQYQQHSHEVFQGWKKRPYGITTDCYCIVDFSKEERPETYFWIAPHNMSGLVPLRPERTTYQVSHNGVTMGYFENMHSAKAQIPHSYLTWHDWIQYQGENRNARTRLPFEGYMEHYKITVTYHDPNYPGGMMTMNLEYYAPADIQRYHFAVGIDFGGVVIPDEDMKPFRHGFQYCLEVKPHPEAMAALKTLNERTQGKCYILCKASDGTKSRILEW